MYDFFKKMPGEYEWGKLLQQKEDVLHIGGAIGLVVAIILAVVFAFITIFALIGWSIATIATLFGATMEITYWSSFWLGIAATIVLMFIRVKFTVNIT